MIRFSVLILFVFIAACERLMIAPEPENTPENNFEIFWNAFDRYYSYFNYKKIDWDSVYNLHRPGIDKSTTSEELFQVLKDIVISIEDGHTVLYRGSERVSYSFLDQYPVNGPDNAFNYLQNFKKENGSIEWAEVKNSNLGYIRIRFFGRNREEYKAIDEIIPQLNDKSGIIIDVRSNGGGSDLNSDLIASRFIDKKRLYRKHKYRNGPEHDDFTDWFEDYIEPEGNNQFTKPVVVLTNRACYSSTEDFVLAMRVAPHVTIVGDTTGGGSGNPIRRELLNGWTFQLSSWISVPPDENIYEGIGLYPDVPVWKTEEDEMNNKDTILETAIGLFN